MIRNPCFLTMPISNRGLVAYITSFYGFFNETDISGTIGTFLFLWRAE